MLTELTTFQQIPTYTHIERVLFGTTNARDPMACIGLFDSNLPKEINLLHKCASSLITEQEATKFPGHFGNNTEVRSVIEIC